MDTTVRFSCILYKCFHVVEIQIVTEKKQGLLQNYPDIFNDKQIPSQQMT